MKPTTTTALQGRPSSSNRHPNDEIPSSVPPVVGFPVSENQFQILSKSIFADSQSQVQEEANLVNPTSTSLQRLHATRGTKYQRILLSEGVSKIIIHLYRDE